MVRTPSFIKFFGDWETNYSKGKYDLWIKSKHIEDLREKLEYMQHSFDRLERPRSECGYDNGSAVSLKVQIEMLISEIEKLEGELIREHFNELNFDWTKILDENGEPLLLARSIDRPLDHKGRFTVPERTFQEKNLR